MPASLYDLTIGSYVQILQAATGFLQKGADHRAAEGIDPAEIVVTRLIRTCRTSTSTRPRPTTSCA